MGLAQQSFGAGLEHGPAALFDLWLPASQLGKELFTFSRTADLAPRHRLAVTSWRTQFQIASSALKSGL